MSILGKYTKNIEYTKLLNSKAFTLPAVVREDRDCISMRKAFFLSLIFHVATVVLVYAFSLILLWLGIDLALLNKPKPKAKDIEFTIVEKPNGTPINKNTRFRAEHNSRAGGHHDPTQAIDTPNPASVKKTTSSKSSSAPKQQKPVQQPKQSLLDKVTKPLAKPAQKPSPSPAPMSKEVARPNPPTAKPSLKPPTVPKAVQKPSSAFQVPVPKGGTGSGTYATGPISGSGTAVNGGSKTNGTGTSGNSTGKFAPAPALSHSGTGSGTGTGSGSKLGGSGTGNPGPGNPNGAPGIDAIKTADFGPWMSALKRKIKMNWHPPKGEESRQVILAFKVAKDGRLLTCSVLKSSGLKAADDAAIQAVKAAAPFKPLPPEHKGADVDIKFTFDYTVFGATKY